MAQDSLPAFSDYKMDDVLSSSWVLDSLGNAAKKSSRAITIDWELFHDLAKNPDITKEWPRIMHMETPVITVAGIFLVFAVVALLVAFFFCCCCVVFSCCNGELKAEEVRDQSLIEFLALLLAELILISVISFLVVLMVVCSMRIGWTYNLAIQSTNDTVSDIGTFMNDTMMQLDYLKDNFQNDYFIQKTDGIQLRLTTDVSNVLLPFLNNFNDDFTQYSDAFNALENIAGETTKTSEEIVQGVKEVRLKLVTLSNTTEELKDDCASHGYDATFCGNLPSSAAFSDPTTQINLENLTQIYNGLREFIFSSKIVSRRTSHDDMVFRLTEELPGKFVSELHKILQEKSPELADSVKAVFQVFSADVGTHFDTIQGHVESVGPFFIYFLDIAKPYFKMGGYAAFGLTSTLAIVVLLIIMGLIGGFRGMLTPTVRGLRSEQTICGYRLLRCSVFLSFMVVFAFCAVSGGLYTFNSQLGMICKTFDNMEIFDEVIDNSTYFSFDEDIFDVTDFADPGPSMKSILLKCRNGSSVFNALNVNLEKQRENIKTAIESAGTFDSITVDDIGSTIIQAYEDFQPAISNTYLKILQDLDELSKVLIQQMTDTASDLVLNQQDIERIGDVSADCSYVAISILAANNESTYGAAYQQLGMETNNLHTFLLTDLKPSLDSLKSWWEKVAQNLPPVVDSGSKLNESSKQLTDAVRTDAPESCRMFIENLANETKSWEQELITHIGNQLSTDIGRCSAIWKIYEGLVAVPCYHFSNCVNAFWLLLVLAVVFLVLNLIASCHLTKHFRKPDDEKEFLYKLEEYEREQEEMAAAFEANMMVPEDNGPNNIEGGEYKSAKRQKEAMEKKQQPKGLQKLLPSRLRKTAKKPANKNKPIILSDKTKELIENYKRKKEERARYEIEQF